jgi:PncC family amidohydrolase
MINMETEARAEEAARKLVERLASEKRTLALAESCTGGLVAELITRISGASSVFWGSFVTYTPEAKETMLHIGRDFLARYGLVSGETSREMALKTLEISGSSVAAAVTGLAGPLGDGGGLPVGTVRIAVALSGGSGLAEGRIVEKELFFQGTRAEVRMQAAAAVLEELLDRIVPAE